jgi:phosphatidylglycerol:prolipoprotein diacylglycerol transferase
MHPILARFSLGGTEVVLHAYSTFYVLAWVVAVALATLVAWRRGISWWRVLAISAVSLGLGTVGARLFDLAVNWDYYAGNTSRIYDFGFRGFALYGGLILAFVAGAALTKLLRLDLWRLADSAVPALVAGIVLMRVGCFLNGCCFGTETSLPWGVTFPAGSPAWAQQILSGGVGLLGFGGEAKPVHPTQLYEIIAALVFGGLAMWLLSRKRSSGVEAGDTAATPSGLPFLAFVLAFTLFRLGNNFLRARLPTSSLPGWFYPIFYVLISVVVTVLIVWRVRSSRQAVPATEGGMKLGE